MSEVETCIEGIVELRHPTPYTDLWLNYVILAIAAVFEGRSWSIALRDFRARKGKLGYFQAFRQSKDSTTFAVLPEDSAALLGLLVAFIGIYGGSVLHTPWMDGAASVGIGLGRFAVVRTWGEALIKPRHSREGGTAFAGLQTRTPQAARSASAMDSASNPASWRKVVGRKDAGSRAPPRGLGGLGMMRNRSFHRQLESELEPAI